MYSWLLLVLALPMLGLLLWTFRQWQVTHSGLMLFVLLPLAAVPVELLVVGTGRWLGPGQALLELSGIPILWWTLTLPLALFSLATLCRRIGFAWAQIDWGHGAVCLGAVALLLWKLPTMLTIKHLDPACWQDTLRYVRTVLPAETCVPGEAAVGAGPGLPLALWVVFGAFAATGAGLWRHERWPWLVWPLILALALLAMPAELVGPLPAYIGKALGFAGLALTVVHYGQQFAITPGKSIPVE